MNTRLLMILRVTVATPQSIGAVPHGTRRTVPIAGGDFEGGKERVRECLGGEGLAVLAPAGGPPDAVAAAGGVADLPDVPEFDLVAGHAACSFGSSSRPRSHSSSAVRRIRTAPLGSFITRGPIPFSRQR